MRPGIELTKWLGVICMIYDHLEYFGGVDLPMASAVGALAFPFFAIALAAALADSKPGKREIVVKRLLIAAIIAQVAVVLVRDVLPLNVIFTLAAGVIAYGALEAESEWRKAGMTAVALIIGTLAEFSFIGTGVVLLAMAHYRVGWSKWWVVGACVPLFAFNEMQMIAPVGAWLAFWLVDNGPVIPRIKRVFYPVYVLQYPLLRLL